MSQRIILSKLYSITSRGTWGNYAHCNMQYAICAVKVRMAKHEGDGTALNGAAFLCCLLHLGKGDRFTSADTTVAPIGKCLNT